MSENNSVSTGKKESITVTTTVSSSDTTSVTSPPYSNNDYVKCPFCESYIPKFYVENYCPVCKNKVETK